MNSSPYGAWISKDPQTMIRKQMRKHDLFAGCRIDVPFFGPPGIPPGPGSVGAPAAAASSTWANAVRLGSLFQENTDTLTH